MATRSSKKIPRFYGLRIYLSSTILYYWLVLPFLLILIVKYGPELRQKHENADIQSEFITDSTFLLNDTLIDTQEFDLTQNRTMDSVLSQLNTEEYNTNNDSGEIAKIDFGPVDLTVRDPDPDLDQSIDGSTQVGKAFNFLFNLIIISFLLGFIFNLPFKRYFSRKRKGKTISGKLHNFCKRFLLKSPIINAGILGLTYVIAHVYMISILFTEGAFNMEYERSRFLHLFFISLVSSILSLLFVYFWQKHRVHIKYIEHVYDETKLRKRIFNLKAGKIRNRMFVSAAMTTLLPLTIVILYLFLSVTYLRDLNLSDYTEGQKNILFGDNMTFRELFSNSAGDLTIPDKLFYINVINSFMMFIGITSSIFIAFIYILFFVKWATQDIVQPMKELLENMKQTGKGEMNNFGIVRTNDEIGELTEGYNDMSNKLGEYIQNISNMTEAYSHFVPRQFLDYLGKESFVDIKLGDQVEKEMTVLFSDIRSFTEISEHMTPKENFDFINYYLGYMEPVIRNNNGFIDKYIGDSIMALFSETAEDAINSSIEMRIKLSQFNQIMDQFGKPSINSGIGIHSGSLMLGVVGGEGRMDGTVISDAVNLAARLEGLTKLYGSSIIISQDTLIKLNNPTQYNYRFLDIVKVKGKKEAVYIFEVIDGDADDIKLLKLKTKDHFAEGINHYKAKNFKEALKLFNSVYSINNHDITANLYVSRCNNFIKNGVPEEWDGIETISWD